MREVRPHAFAGRNADQILAGDFSGWRNMLEKTLEMLKLAMPGLKELALGGTAVGTGLNCSEGLRRRRCKGGFRG